MDVTRILSAAILISPWVTTTLPDHVPDLVLAGFEVSEFGLNFAVKEFAEITIGASVLWLDAESFAVTAANAAVERSQGRTMTITSKRVRIAHHKSLRIVKGKNVGRLK